MILSQDDLKDVKPSENYENNDENEPSTSKIPRTVSFNVPSVRVLVLNLSIFIDDFVLIFISNFIEDIK